MSEPADEPNGVQTVCHGCRSMRETIEHTEPHGFVARSMVVPGDGTVYERVQANFGGSPGDAVVEELCPVCGGSGWLPGLQAPI